MEAILLYSSVHRCRVSFFLEGAGSVLRPRGLVMYTDRIVGFIGSDPCTSLTPLAAGRIQSDPNEF